MSTENTNRQGWLSMIGKLQKNNANAADKKRIAASRETNRTSVIRRGKLPPLENPPKVVITEEQPKPLDHEDEQLRSYENSSCEMSENGNKNSEDIDGLEASNFSSMARTIQVASSWLKRSRKTSKEHRTDSFLDRLEMFGPSATLGNLEPPQDVAIHKYRIVDPSGRLLFGWLIIVAIAVLYNLIFIIARQCFHQLHDKYKITWFILDYICDVIYAVDMFFQFRTGKNGFLESFVTRFTQLLKPVRRSTVEVAPLPEVAPLHY